VRSHSTIPLPGKLLPSRAHGTPRLALAALLAISSRSVCLAQATRAPFERSFSGLINNLGVINSGIAWADYDNDGDLDVFMSTFENENNVIFQNIGGRKFRKVDVAPVTSDAGNSSGAAWGDFDNDGLPDLAVANQGGQDNFLYHNLGGGRFERVTARPVAEDRGDSYSVSWADYDGDGLLDLLATNRGGSRDFLYHNLGAGAFARVDSGVFATRRGASFTSTWGDYDGDGRIDVFVADPGRSTPNRLYHNLGGGKFELITSGPVAADVAISNGAAWGDFDNDGDLDLYVANGYFDEDGEQTPFFYRNDGGSLTRITMGPVATDAFSGLAPAWLDYDNDGDLDLLVTAYREHNRLYRNEGGGTFTRVLSGFLVSYGGYNDAVAVADYDRDGALDVMISHWEHQNPWLLTNVAGANHFLGITLVGTKSNRDAIGAKIWATTDIGGRAVTQFRQIGSETGGRGQSAREAHFGLGGATQVSKLRIVWPSGAETSLENVAADAFLTVEESRGLVATAQRDTSSPLGEAAIGLLLGAQRAGGIDSLRRTFTSLRAKHPNEDWGGYLSVLGEFFADGATQADGMAMLELAMAEPSASPTVLFRVAEATRSVRKVREAEALYCRMLAMIDRPRTKASDDDPRDLRYFRITAMRYLGQKTCTPAGRGK
jgi:hypothetical protein